MATESTRFGVGQPDGARSAEWVVMWKNNKSDVYLATRVLGNTMRVSLHESGECFVRGPDPAKLSSSLYVPRRLETWRIDPAAMYEHPIRIVVPTSELRAMSQQAPGQSKNTIWITAPDSKQAVTVGVMFTRNEPKPLDALGAAGWHEIIVLQRLPDGRDLWVVAGFSEVPPENLEAIAQAKRDGSQMITASGNHYASPRVLAFASEGKGTRTIVDIAV